ncbi:competence/damage-inducible protein A [Consotaella salsifontis]|uniref:Molybdenum cofactor synthesis domain-containing protein n=1 Tax=Consotaella salsifontis TaxID=1365950 RepID=A0A1T4TBB9_9HYPH|nr:molybdopterin-binding protein [Consotaella salsifontis]SKA37782.1 molybdenum cofactor synthesis domain-containing protein [Consotaella salsifontis]
MAYQPSFTAAMLVIGDEILSGRTKDKNIGPLAEALTAAGIDLKEVRIIGDEPSVIANSVNTLRRSYDFVFTSGGIGPTHDDVTADAVAAAFGLPIGPHPEAYRRLAGHYAARGIAFTEARQRMARTPEGAELIDNPISIAPGFRIDNVFVMAGIPAVFQAMLTAVLSALPTGMAVISVTIPCPFPEGDIGGPLSDIQARYRTVAIGSYPRFDEAAPTTEIVLRSRDEALLEAARIEVEEMIAAMSRGAPLPSLGQ